MKILVTGSAGFIGYHLAKKLLEIGHEIVGLDNINDYYQVGLKYDRLEDSGISQREIGYNRIIQSSKFSNYRFIKLSLEHKEELNSLFEVEKFDIVVNLAAQAGVRYSIKNPSAYIDSNVVGFTNLLEACRHNSIKHLVFASSSSVYGLTKEVPFKESDNTDYPISLYGATKKSNELMAHVYSQLFDLPITGLRFFTVYGPWGRPDMAYFLFADAILKGDPIKVFNNGELSRDFTYVDDIVTGITHVMNAPPEEMAVKTTHSKARFKMYNIGNNNPIKLIDFITEIETALGVEAIKEYLPMQQGDVLQTYADVSELIADHNYKPTTDLKEGISKFMQWYKAKYLKNKPKNA